MLAAAAAPTKFGMRWWTGRGSRAMFSLSIRSQILFLILHFHALGSSPSSAPSSAATREETSAIDRRASASRRRRSASKEAASNGSTPPPVAPQIRRASPPEHSLAGKEATACRPAAVGLSKRIRLPLAGITHASRARHASIPFGFGPPFSPDLFVSQPGLRSRIRSLPIGGSTRRDFSVHDRVEHAPTMTCRSSKRFSTEIFETVKPVDFVETYNSVYFSTLILFTLFRVKVSRSIFPH